MKKLILTLGLSLLVIGCGSKEEGSKVEGSSEKEITLKVGSTIPGVDILNNLKDDFKKEGIDLEVIEFTDYVTPNLALSDGDIDANFFQHKPYLDNFMEERNLDLRALESVLITPIGIYSNKYKSLDEVKDGDRVGIPNDPTNLARGLLVLQDAGLIKVDESKGIKLLTTDIVENPKNLEFVESEAAMLPRMKDELDIVFINGNYAVSSGLNPKTDSIYIEKKDSPYTNIVAVREGDQDRPEIKTLMKLMRSDKTRQFIIDNYDGGMLPTF